MTPMTPDLPAPGARILIAEDDPAMRELLAALVTTFGYTPVPVPDGAAALAAVADQAPALVLSDLGMPHVDGYTLCKRLKADPATRLIPVVLITGIGEEFKAAGIEAGADEFLSKPVQSKELRLRLRSLLRMKAFTDALESAEAVLCTLGKSIEAKDPATEDHCARLADDAVALGQALGLASDDLTALRLGAFLHDLGKVSIPEAILLKPGPLSPAEWTIMQRHPLIGEAICRPLHSLARVLPIIRSHHERQDGTGYPDGLQGDAIPLTARTLQVVDVYDALTTARPYRQAVPPVQALDLLDTEVQAGWWDPAIVRVFRTVVEGRKGQATSSQRSGGRSGRERIPPGGVSHEAHLRPNSLEFGETPLIA